MKLLTNDNYKKQILFLLLLFPTVALFFSCDNIDYESSENKSHVPITSNNLPIGKETYKILAIGNSYTEDGTAYIKDILAETSIDKNDYCLYTVRKGSTSLKFWNEQIFRNDSLWAELVAGEINEIPNRFATLREFINHDWDVIVLQQFSQDAINYNTYNPYLTNILNYIYGNCPNKDVAIAWHLIHSYSKNYSMNKGIVGDNRWQKIASATQRMMSEDGIHIIIPTGTAIQMARHSSLQTPYELTRDNTHLCYGTGRYIAACTWIEALFNPVFGISVEGNTALHLITDKERNDRNVGFLPYSSVDVDETNRALCQEMAIRACRNPFTLND